MSSYSTVKAQILRVLEATYRVIFGQNPFGTLKCGPKLGRKRVVDIVDKNKLRSNNTRALATFTSYAGYTTLACLSQDFVQCASLLHYFYNFAAISSTDLPKLGFRH